MAAGSSLCCCRRRPRRCGVPSSARPPAREAGTCASVGELEQALEQCGLDVSQWGKRVEGSLTKTVLDLWEELASLWISIG